MRCLLVAFFSTEMEGGSLRLFFLFLYIFLFGRGVGLCCRALCLGKFYGNLTDLSGLDYAIYMGLALSGLSGRFFQDRVDSWIDVWTCSLGARLVDGRDDDG
ncbi:hypothetical protein GGS21DRAFT_495987 [Xylaria nigripes]|nr:hypothetical protein GGS21DRAFT_495987 [Xylaria nigripes]